MNTELEQQKHFKKQVVEYSLAKQFIMDLNPDKPEMYFQDNWLERPYGTGWDTTPKHSDADIARILKQATQRHIVNNEALGRR